MFEALHIFVQGLQRTSALLFHPATASFGLVALQMGNGTWQQSYTQHLAAKQDARRIWSLTSLGVLASGVVVLNYVLHWFA